MKKIYQAIVILLLTVWIPAFLSSCSKDDSDGDGNPVINYVRVTKPESADSLLVGAGQGQLVAIVGDNLQNVRQVFFNDKESVLTPTYVTNKTVLVAVPSQVPEDITNKMRLIFANGFVLEHDFRTEINKPQISGMACEYVPAGGTAIIRGNYFYKPVKVAFNGGAEAEVLSVKDDRLEVLVPEGAQPGQITITTNFGTNKSDFWFRDNRNIFISSDPYTGWWNESFVVKRPGAGDPPAINGNYIRVKQFIGSWSWIEVAGGLLTQWGLLVRTSQMRRS
ncbi:glycan-binding surface protein [Arcticibacter sp. MXS-1]|uniref:glycan-binding surface protein n=1 Tax=Arcticibacter sp. MXS-1 TaxID=3341726 RepID=UPI0035A898CC